ncbi:MAG: NUDIX hydrolase [Gammaproteobacteria bacterium]|jgi:ADP-ribose pyrophosphatase YjhB (NUDIX family)
MDIQPLGELISYCPYCGGGLNTAIPAGDNRLRYVCSRCDAVSYQNPKVVVGCVTEFGNRILLCKRAIEPRLGYWTVPAGFMELGETLEQGAARETLEEACANIQVGSLLAVVDVLEAGQVHVFFRGKSIDGHYGAGDESIATSLYAPEDIPWPEIAFRSGYIALKQFFAQKETGTEWVHTETATRAPRD